MTDTDEQDEKEQILRMMAEIWNLSSRLERLESLLGLAAPAAEEPQAATDKDSRKGHDVP